jgi:hypothetical protein
MSTELPPSINNFQRVGAISNAHAGREFEIAAQRFFSGLGIGLERDLPISVGYTRRKTHRFDLGSTDPPILVECKSYTWTSGWNSPSAKIRSLNEVMLLFSVAPNEYRKILFMLRHMKGETSLAAHYIRNQGHLIPPLVEIWEFDPDTLSGEQLVGP